MLFITNYNLTLLGAQPKDNEQTPGQLQRTQKEVRWRKQRKQGKWKREQRTIKWEAKYGEQQRNRKP